MRLPTAKSAMPKSCIAGCLKLRARKSWVCRDTDGGRSCAREAPLQFLGKQQVCQLALTIGCPTTIGAFSVEIVKVDATMCRGSSHACQGHDAAVRRVEQPG